MQKHESEFALSVKRGECDVSHLPMEITEKEKYIYNTAIATSIETWQCHRNQRGSMGWHLHLYSGGSLYKMYFLYSLSSQRALNKYHKHIVVCI